MAGLKSSMIAVALMGALAALGGPSPEPRDLMRQKDKQRRTKADVAELRAKQDAKLARRAKRAGK